MQKYVVEEGCATNYPGCEIISRKLFNTEEQARAYFDKVLSENYSKEEIEELKDECSGNSFLANYILDWQDDEQDVYLFLYSVDVVE